MKTFQLRTLSVLLGALGAFTYSPWAQAQLMFSQYVDGSSNRKGLEIYNPNGTTVNLADYEIQQFNNGGTAKTATFRLQGSLTSKQKFLVGRSELQAELGSKVNQVAALSFNGDDAVVLVYKGTPVDRFGRIGERPEAGWGTAVSSLGNSFKRIETENPALSIDATAAFDLDHSWTAWANRNDFSNLSGSTTQPPVQAVSCSSSDTPIADLSTAAQNQSYTVRGVITADYRYANGFSGFYVQTPDTKARANISNAIFVYIPNSSAVKGGQVGDEVILRGRLTTYQNQLQLDQLQQDIQTCNSNMANQVQPISLELPFASLTGSSTHSPQRYQGMLVKLPQTLTVSENYNYGRYGELSLSLGRLYIPN